MANNDPRIKFFEENGVYTRAQKARDAREGRRSEPVDVTQIPRLATLLPESRAANDAQLQEHRERQVENKYSLINVARAGWRQPPGTKYAVSKEQLVNGGERKG